MSGEHAEQSYDEVLAGLRGVELDPLAAAVPDLVAAEEATGSDPFEQFIEQDLQNRGIQDKTIEKYRRLIEQWRAHMAEMGRHPACPNAAHVEAFIEAEMDDRGHAGVTVNGKLGKLHELYRFWVAKKAYPHSADYDPFEEGRKRYRGELRATNETDYPYIAPDDLRAVLADVTNVRERAVIVLMLKLGLRVGEVVNVRLSDMNLTHPDLRAHYDDLGTHERVEEYENALYVPPSLSNDHAGVPGRDGNKSKNPRVLPVDDEVRRVLINYLLVRPDSDEHDEVFLSARGEPLTRSTVNREMWRPAFAATNAAHPDRRDVTSHYGRHYFSDYWAGRSEMETQDVQYLRGDRLKVGDEGDAINTYLHRYYENIEQPYRDHVYTFGF